MANDRLMNRVQLYNALKSKDGVALFSLWDKTGVEDRAKRLADMNIGIIASRGTLKPLNAAGIPDCYDVAILTGEPPSGDHLVVTISGPVARSLLARSPEHLLDLQRRRIPKIDMVWEGLYPLEEEIAKMGCTPESVRAATDIGGRVNGMEAAKGEVAIAYTPEKMDEIIEWWAQGRPAMTTFLDQCAWEANMRIGEYSIASAMYQSNGAAAERLKALAQNCGII